MFEYLPGDIRTQLESARMDALRRKSRLRVRMGEGFVPILRFRSEWFSLPVAQVEHLHGVVDVYDGGRHLFECLIYAAEVDGDELVCRVKWSTAAVDRAPLDYARDENAPVALLPKN